jgi:hypothetical protein
VSGCAYQQSYCCIDECDHDVLDSGVLGVKCGYHWAGLLRTVDTVVADGCLS